MLLIFKINCAVNSLETFFLNIQSQHSFDFLEMSLLGSICEKF